MKIFLIVTILFSYCSLTVDSYSQRLVDKNKGNHNNTKKGFMDGNLVETVYRRH